MGNCNSFNQKEFQINQVLHRSKTYSLIDNNPFQHGELTCEFNIKDVLLFNFLFDNEYNKNNKGEKTKIYFLEIKLNGKKFPLVAGVGVNPLFIHTITEKITFTENNELSKKYLQITILKIKSDNIKSNEIAREKELDKYIHKTENASGIKIDLQTLLFGPNNYDIMLQYITRNKILGRITFKTSCYIIQQFKIIINDFNIKNSNEEYKLQMLLDIKNKSYNSDKITLNREITDLILLTENHNIEDLYLGSLSLIIENNDNIKEKKLIYINLNHYKDVIILDPSIDNETQVNSQIEIDGKLLYISFKLSLPNLPPISSNNNVFFTEDGIQKSNTCNYLYLDKDFSLISSSYTQIKPQLQEVFNQLREVSFDVEHKANLPIYKRISAFRTLMLKSILIDKYLYYYNNKEEIADIIVLIFKIAKELFRFIEHRDSNGIIDIINAFKVISQREEMNSVYLYDILNNKKDDDEFKLLFDGYYQNCLFLNSLVDSKLKPTMEFSLSELYANLYFDFESIQFFIIKSMSNERDKEIQYTPKEKSLENFLSQNTIKQISNIKPQNLFPNIIIKGAFYFNIIKGILINKHNALTFFNKIPDRNDINQLIQSFKDYLKTNKIQQFQYYINEITSLFFLDERILNEIITIVLSKTNAYDSYDVFASIDFIHYILINSLIKYRHKPKVNYALFEKVAIIITSLDNSLAIAKILWLYYSDGHIIDSNHMMWMTLNVLNKKFYFFAFHWSWKIRILFFKLILYIIHFRLKEYEIEKFISNEKLDSLSKDIEYFKTNKQLLLNEEVRMTCIEDGLKDYAECKREFNIWEKKTKYNKFLEYPTISIFLPSDGDNT